MNIRRLHIRNLYRAAVLLLLAGLLGSCSLSNRSSRTELQADEEGRLIQTIVEPAEKSLSVSDLEEYITVQVDAFNGRTEDASDASESSVSGRSGSTEAVTLDSCKIKDGSVQIRLTYRDAEAYRKFNGTTCFHGTVREAEDAGYQLDQGLLNEKGNEAEDAAETIRERAAEWKVLIVEEPMRLRVPDKILYTSSNIKVTGRTTAEFNEPDAEETVSSSEETASGSTEEASGESGPGAFAEDNFQTAYIIYK